MKKELEALFSSEPAQAESSSNEPQETIPSEEAIPVPPTPSQGEETPSRMLKEQIEANLQSRLSALSPKKNPPFAFPAIPERLRHRRRFLNPTFLPGVKPIPKNILPNG
ncbi:MAG: hypothetical protein IPK21_11355 [Haliscomenobacter sp.]|nr:hypothetical protein [Haliscomenobacter sp.]